MVPSLICGSGEGIGNTPEKNDGFEKSGTRKSHQNWEKKISSGQRWDKSLLLSLLYSQNMVQPSMGGPKIDLKIPTLLNKKPTPLD
jgi:hypothetical protein